MTMHPSAAHAAGLRQGIVDARSHELALSQVGMLSPWARAKLDDAIDAAVETAISVDIPTAAAKRIVMGLAFAVPADALAATAVAAVRGYAAWPTSAAASRKGEQR